MLAVLRSPWGAVKLNITSLLVSPLHLGIRASHHVICSEENGICLSSHLSVVRSQDGLRVSPAPPLGSCGNLRRFRQTMIFWGRVSGHHGFRVTAEERMEWPTASGLSRLLTEAPKLPALMAISWATT